MQTRVENVPTMTVVALRHVGPYPQIGPKFGQLGEWAAKHGVPVLGSLGWWHDNPMDVPEAELKSDACIIVPDDFTMSETDGLYLRLDKVSGGEFAVYTHLGAYEGLGEAWGKFYAQGLPSLGRSPAEGSMLEIYVNDCSKVPVEEVRTDLYIPLAPQN